MKFSYLLIAAAAVLAFGAAEAQAATVSVSSPMQVDAGSTFEVDVNVSGLGDGAAPSLGGYDLRLDYDSALLSVASIAFGGALGTSLQLSDSTFPGFATATEVSFETEEFLNATQPAAFTLFTITFNALAAGTSALALTAAGPFAGADGLTALSVDLVNGSVSSVAPVPLPAAGWLLLSALGGLVAVRRRAAA